MSNIEFELIFDASNTRESLGLPAQPVGQDVILKMDRPLWAYEPADKSTLANAIEQDDFAATVAGPTSTPEYAFDAGSPELIAFRKIRPISKPTALAPGHEMRDLLKSLGKRVSIKANWNSFKHEIAIRAIVNRARSAPVFAPVKDDGAAWDALLNHATDFVREAIQDCEVA